jgi:tetratricopeptide (TPR) repeat protein
VDTKLAGRVLTYCLSMGATAHYTVADESHAFADQRSTAIARYEDRDYSGARARLATLVRAEPGDPELHFYLGRIALWFDDEAAALHHLETAARLAPAVARIQNALGDAYGLAAQNAPFWAKLRWARKCRSAYESAIALDPAAPAYRWSLLGFCLVAPAIAGGGLEEAEALATQIDRLDAVNGRIARATVALFKREFSAAFAEFERVLEEDPDDFIALYHIGRCSALSGIHLERGLAALRRCLELSPPAGDGLPTLACVHYRLGNLLEKQGDPEGARREYALATTHHPDFRPSKIQLRH